MVNTSRKNLGPDRKSTYRLEISLLFDMAESAKVLLAALEPEFQAIDSKRVRLQVKSSRKKIVFLLTADDVTALRAAATSLIRLYTVADGVHQLTVKKNG